MDLKIRRKEVLRYLQTAENLADENINRLLTQIAAEIKSVIKLRYLYQKFELQPTKEGIKIKDTTLTLKGESIKKHLKNSKEVYLMAATLGTQVDRKIAYYEKISVTKSMIFDACATAAIEEACDQIELEIKKKVLADGHQGITFRYSPGYGDLGIDIQQKFLKILKAAKKIGLTASQYNLLLPSKSVTAIIGVLDKEVRGKNFQQKNSAAKKENKVQKRSSLQKNQQKQAQDIEFENKYCSSCLAAEDCRLKKRGIYCGAQR